MCALNLIPVFQNSSFKIFYRILYTIILTFILILPTNGQDSEYLENEIWVQLDTLHFNNKSQQNDFLHATFKKYKMHTMYQLFPYSKNPFLRSLYKVKFDGKRDSLILELRKNKIIKNIYKRPLEKINPTYDPSDYMWYLTKNDSLHTWLWHLKKIEADKAWDITKGKSEVKVALLDIEMDINHPDLKNQILFPYDPYDGGPLFIGCPKGHGTAVASFIAAETDGGGQLASIGFNTKLICYRSTSGLLDSVASDFLERAHQASFVFHADVFTTSTPVCQQKFDTIAMLVTKEILDNGTIIVMPAGNGVENNCNNGPFGPLSAKYDERVIVVTSTDINDKHQYIVNGIDKTHSHYPEVDICAPGYCLMGAAPTTFFDPTTKQCVPNSWPYFGCSTGTSFATPIVAGVCALMKSIDPCLTPAKAQSIIKANADPVVDANNYPGLIGAGRINAFKCVKATGTKTLSGNVSGYKIFSAGYAANLQNVNVQNYSNIKVVARCEINVVGTLNIPLGNTMELTIDPNAVNSCNW